MVSRSGFKNKKVLVTCGPTWVAIDGVRVLGNLSSGELGHRVCAGLLALGAQVTLIEGPVTHALKRKPQKVVRFRFFDELANGLARELTRTRYDAVIHAAAVSDYRLRRPSAKKISSHLKTLRLDLVATPKLIERIKRKQPKTFLVGFKLQSAIVKKSLLRVTRSLFEDSHCDLVVVNTLTGAGYEAFVIDRDKAITGPFTSRVQLTRKLLMHLRKNL